MYKIIKPKSENQALTSREPQPLENYENNTVVFDDKLLSKPASNFDLFFTRGHHSIIHEYCKSQSCFNLPNSTIRNISKISILFKQTSKDITLLNLDMAGLGMSLQEWKQLGRKDWGRDYESLQIDRFA